MRIGEVRYVQGSRVCHVFISDWEVVGEQIERSREWQVERRKVMLGVAVMVLIAVFDLGLYVWFEHLALCVRR